MSSSGTCPNCGAPLTGVGQGVCLRCLVELGVELNTPADSFSAAGSEPNLGESVRFFGDYESLEEIARGGMGIVYKARQTSLNRVVALKMLPAGLFAQEESVQRFRAEAEAIAQLQHPSIVTIHEIGQHDGQPYFTMDYIAGRTLAEIVREGPLAGTRAAGYVKAIAEGVQYAHEHGLIHRDLKPSNVIIDENDQPRITDFGLAKRLGQRPEIGDQRSELTITGQVLGSPNYLPPEQAEPKRGPIGPTSDVYALGGILYHLVVGRPPFQGESLTAVLRQVLDTEPVAPRLLNPSLARDLETICLKCLEKEAGKRYPTARALAEELDRFVRNEPIRARPVNRPERAWRWCRRKPQVASLGAIAVMLLLSGLAGVLWQWRQAERQRARAEERAYISDINSAQAALEAGNPARAVHLLDAQRPRQSEPGELWSPERDLRGLEWRYLWQECQAEAGTHFAQLSNPIRSLAASKDGRWLAAGSDRGEVRAWNLASGRETRLLPNQEWKSYVAFSPDSSELIFSDQSAASWGTIRAWHTETGASRILLTNSEPVGIPTLSPDGKWFGFGIVDTNWRRKARVLEYPGMSQAGEEQTLTEVQDDFHGLQAVFTADSRAIVFTENDPDRSIGFWDFQAKRPPQHFRGPPEAIVALAVSPDNRLLATGSAFTDQTIRLWELPSCRELGVLTGHEGWISGLAFSPDGKLLASASADQTVRLWDVLTRTQKWSSRPLLHEARHVCFAPDGRTLFSGCNDGSIHRWPTTLSHAAKTSWQSASNLQPSSLALCQTRLGAIRKGIVWVGEVENSQLTEPIPELGTNNESITFLPGGEFLLAGSEAGQLRVWSFAGRKVERVLLLSPLPIAKLVPDRFGRRLIALQSEGQTVARGRPWRVSVINVADWREHKAWEVSGYRQACALSPNGRWLATGDPLSSVRLWDLEQNAKPVSFEFGTVFDLAFSPDGQLLAGSSNEGEVAVWKLSPPGQVIRFPAQPHGVYSLVFSSDGRRLITGGDDLHALKVWDVRTWRELTAVPLTASLQQVALSHDSRRLFAVTAQGDLWCWQIPSFAEITEQERSKPGNVEIF